jgi:hypothetical protein
VPRHEVRARFGEQGIDVLAFSSHAVTVAVWSAEATPSPVGHVDGKRARKCPRQLHVVLRGQIAAPRRIAPGPLPFCRCPIVVPSADVTEPVVYCDVEVLNATLLSTLECAVRVLRESTEAPII